MPKLVFDMCGRFDSYQQFTKQSGGGLGSAWSRTVVLQLRRGTRFYRYFELLIGAK
jgi:hypothetical protein